MKTKHKLKLLKELQRCSPEYETLSKHLYLEAIDNPSWTLKIESVEPIQETKDPELERFEIGEIVEVLSNKAYPFLVGTKVQIIEDTGTFYKCQVREDGNLYYLPVYEIKKLPKPTINKKELRKHLEAAYQLWNKPPFGRVSLIDKYLETL